MILQGRNDEYIFDCVHAPGSMGMFGLGNRLQSLLKYPIYPSCTGIFTMYTDDVTKLDWFMRDTIGSISLYNNITELTRACSQHDMFVTVRGSSGEVANMCYKIAETGAKGIVIYTTEINARSNAALAMIAFQATGLPIMMCAPLSVAEELLEFEEVQAVLVQDPDTHIITQQIEGLIPILPYREPFRKNVALSHKFPRKLKNDTN